MPASPRATWPVRRLEQLARELRRGRTVSPETQRHNERVAVGLRVTGDVIRWTLTRDKSGEGVPIAQRARERSSAVPALGYTARIHQLGHPRGS